MSWAKDSVFSKLHVVTNSQKTIEDIISLHLQFNVTKLTKDSFTQILEKLNAGITSEDATRLADQLVDSETERIDVKQLYECYYGFFPREDRDSEGMEEVRKAAFAGFFDVREVLKECSADKNFLNSSQFEVGLKKMNVKLTDEQIKTLFEKSDKAKTGMVSCKQFASNLEEYSLAKSPISSNNPNFSIIRQIRFYIKSQSTNTMAALFKNIVKLNLDGRRWVTRKDFKAALAAMQIDLDAAKFESLTDFLDPGSSGQIDYDYFCEVLGYVQSQEGGVGEAAESKVVNPGLVEKIVEEVAISVRKGDYKLQEMLRKKDDARNGTVSKTGFMEIIRTVRGGLEYNEQETIELCNYFEDPTTHNIKYNDFLSRVNQALQKSAKEKLVRANLQWAGKILDEICICLSNRRQTAYEFFKAYGLNPENKSVPFDSFEEGIRAMEIEITEGELNRLKQDLDADGDRTISAEEFAVQLEERKELALARYEKEVIPKVRDYVKARSINFKGAMEKHDEYNTKRVNSDDFKKELRGELKGLLTEQQYNFLVSKYEIEKGKVAYMEFVNDTAAKKNVDGEELVDKLRESIHSLNIKAASYLTSLDSADKTYKTNILLEIFPRSVLTIEEYEVLSKLVEKSQPGKFTFEEFCELFWTNAAEEAEREHAASSAAKLGRNIRTFCKNKNIDLKKHFEQLDPANTGYLPANSIKDVFFEVGLKFSFKQLSCLLYHQGIRTNEKYWKSYRELLEKIGDESASLSASMDSVVAEAMMESKPEPAKTPEEKKDNAKAFVPSKKASEEAPDAKEEVVREERQKEIKKEEAEKAKSETEEMKKGEKVQTAEERKDFPGLKEIQLDEPLINYLTEQFDALRKFLRDKKVDARAEFSKHEVNGYIDFKDFYQVLESNSVDLEDPDVLNAFYSYLKEDQEGKVSARRLYDALLRGKVLSQYKRAKEVAKSEPTATGIQRLAEFMEENDIPLSSLKKFALAGGVLRKEQLSKTLAEMEYPFTQVELSMIFKSICVRDNATGSAAHLLTLVNDQHVKNRPKALELTSENREVLKELSKEMTEKKVDLQRMLNANGDGYLYKDEFAPVLARAGSSLPAEKLTELFSALDVHNVTVLPVEFLLKQIAGSETAPREPVSNLPIDEQISSEAEDLFFELDTHKNGALNEEDFFKAVVASSHNRCTREEVKGVMRRLDKDNSNYIRKEEFVKYMETRIKADIMTADDEMVDLKALLKEYDFGNNGYLTPNEIYSVLSSECSAVHKSDLEEIFEELDPNKEDKINIDEFVDYIRNPVRQTQLDKKTGKYRAILALKHQRRLNCTEFFNYFGKLSNSMFYAPSFVSKLHSMGKNLPSESFKATRNASGLGYVDIEPAIGPSSKPANTLREIPPDVAGYIVFNTATGVPIPNPALLKREDIVHRAIKVIFYDNKNSQYLHGSAMVVAGWSASEEHTWTFNSVGKVGTNPLVFKWNEMPSVKQIDVVFELVSLLR